MASLFDATIINGMELKNRFLRSGTWTGMATEDGIMTSKLKSLLVDVARGGAAAIVPDYMPVAKDGISANRQLGIYEDKHVDGLADMVNSVHDAGAKVVAQINHGGAHANPELTGVESKGPSAIPQTDSSAGGFEGCSEMTQQDIDQVVEAFRKAEGRCKQAGFDGIQIHCAHGYLFSEFISPFYNKRTDQYGGNIIDRTRIVTDTYNTIRKELGSDYPILVKMNVTDFLDDGLGYDEALQIAKIFADIGIDAIELSGGTGWGMKVMGDLNRSPMRMVKEEDYYRDVASKMKNIFSTPVILTGGIRSFQTADNFLQNNTADYIGLCRSLIHEPGLINRWQSGNTADSGCISCNGCGMAAMMSGEDLACVQKKQE